MEAALASGAMALKKRSASAEGLGLPPEVPGNSDNSPPHGSGLLAAIAEAKRLAELDE